MCYYKVQGGVGFSVRPLKSAQKTYFVYSLMNILQTSEIDSNRPAYEFCG